MQLATRTLRAVEALHVIVLLLFSAFVPFCLNDAIIEDYAVVSAAPPAAAQGVAGLDGAEAPAAAKFAAVVADRWPAAAAGDAKGAAARVAGGAEAAEELEGERDRCGEDQSRLTALPFLIAVVGGGVFSLEAFEAFPML
mmetsp:Transcript_68464/g.191852  ORF Transcript_68464/g.191852 Transcript_68464/m.191852 type:complete len:140 (+) Transcript_68464:105-524(+)